MPAGRPNSAVGDWLTLLRPGFAPSAAANAVAGAAVAVHAGRDLGPWTVAVAAAAPFLAYLGGMAWNDYADRHRDVRLHPARPLPSGRIPAPAALAAGTGCMAAALFASFFAGPWAAGVAAALVATVALYDFVAKRAPWAGVAAMGVNRTLAMGVGVAAVLTPRTWVGEPDALVLVPALCLGLVTGAVTWLSLWEEREHDPLAVIPGILTAALAGLCMVEAGRIAAFERNVSVAGVHHAGAVALEVLAVVGWLRGFAAYRAAGRPGAAGLLVLTGLKTMLVLDAALCLAVGRPGAAAAVGVLWLLSHGLRRATPRVVT